jgi:hypothetical protein
MATELKTLEALIEVPDRVKRESDYIETKMAGSLRLTAL